MQQLRKVASVTFHVPEAQRIAPGALKSARGDLGSVAADGNNGAFVIGAVIPGRRLLILASDGEGWEHVSVTLFGKSLKKRAMCPTWAEMRHVKSLFWDGCDVVVQYHPPESDYVNIHPGCLHLWRQADVEFPAPPSFMVGGLKRRAKSL